MTFKRRKTDRGAGRVDGGEGRGVRLGGSDTGMPPTGYRASVDTFDEEESTSYEVYNLLEDEDDNPSDRRRDPLRRI
jgi:hypothetical protein